MQTFLPYPDFRESVRSIDPSRLGNQVWREGMTLIRGGWPFHPASIMWRGYERALALYLLNGVKELQCRGRSYWDRPWCIELVRMIDRPIAEIVLPPWLGDERVHSSHRACLLAKDYDYYSRFGWTETPTPPDPVTKKWPYYWPTETLVGVG